MLLRLKRLLSCQKMKLQGHFSELGKKNLHSQIFSLKLGYSGSLVGVYSAIYYPSLSYYS